MSETYTAHDGTMWASYDVWWNVNGRDAARARHKEQAHELLLKADDLLNVSDETLARTGYGHASVLIDLAQLHLRIRDLL